MVTQPAEKDPGFPFANSMKLNTFAPLFWRIMKDVKDVKEVKARISI
jgi:hypothetical protein